MKKYEQNNQVCAMKLVWECGAIIILFKTVKKLKTK